MNLTFLTGDINYLAFGAKWISKKLNNGDFDYWLVVELINMYDATGEEIFKNNRYSISINAVSPTQVNEINFKHAVESCGGSKKEHTDIQKVLILSEYGIYAHLYNISGNDFRKMMKEIHRQLGMIEMLFGFYIDIPENVMGNTGWDFIKGEIGFK